MKDKKSMLDLLEKIKEKVLTLNAAEEEIVKVVRLIDKTKDYFDDYTFEILESVEEVKVNRIRRMVED